MKKVKIKKIVESMLLCITFMMIVLSCHTVKAAVTTLNQDDKGRYCINTADDYYFFVENNNKKPYKTSTIILTNNIEITNQVQGVGMFKGTFDGQGHTISYSATDRELSKENNISVFAFNIGYGGVLENTKVQINDAKLYVGDNDYVSTIFDGNDGSIKGLSVTGNITLVCDESTKKWGTSVSIGGGDGKLEDCEISINYNLESPMSSDEIAEKIIDQTTLWTLCQFGNRDSTSNIKYVNCISHGSYSSKISDVAKSMSEKIDLEANVVSGIYVVYSFRYKNGDSTISNCYYDKDLLKDIRVVTKNTEEIFESSELPNYSELGKSTAEMKNKETYKGFDFEKTWSISPDINDGYPYYDPRTVEITLEVQADAEPKVWKTNYARDYNRFKDYSTNYHFPYRVEIINGTKTNIYDDGDNNKVTINGAKIVNQTEETKELIDKYGIKAVCNPETDIESATVDTSFLGQRPLTVKWIKEPVLQFDKGQEAQAEEDGYTFKIKVINGTCEVKDNEEASAADNPANWGTYLTKAEKAIKIILDYCKDKNAFGPKDSPSYENTDIWAIFTAARCGYIPYNDDTYFDKWFTNTKVYLQELKDSGSNLSKWQATDLSKLILAIEAIGYDPRDISSVNLLDAVGKRNGDNYLNTEYAIHAIKSGDYTSSTFTDKEMATWAHNRATSLLNATDGSFSNADNTMNWQPLVYWYGKEGFDDVTKAIDQALHKLPEIAQRATGSFCTAGFETGCMSYGNNAWNDAQALIFASIFDVNVLDRKSGFTKNGNNFLDAFFDLVDVDNGSIHGFTNYDVPQIARGLNAFVRQRNKEQKNFWDFSDVKVPTKDVNNLILALDANSTKEQIQTARDAYEDLLPKYKAIFNKDTLRKLLEAENGKGDSITKVIAAIDALPAADKLTLENKDAVVNVRNLYDALDDEAKSVISNYSKLTAAEAKIKELEKQQEQKEKDKAAAEKVIAAINALPSADALTLDPYVLQLLDNIQAEYNALTEAQKAVQSDELPAQEVPAEGSDFSDGSADAFTSDISEQPAAQMDIQPSEDNADVSNEENTDSVIADEAEVPDADFSTEEEIPAAGDTAKRALTETELKQIAAAKNAYDQLTETEEKKFRSENTALVENMEKLIAMALTYEKGQNEYQQLFADEAALIYTTVKDHPVDRDSYPQVKALLDRYAKDYQGQENAMAGLKVKVGNQEMTFAEVIAALTAQADKAGKDISDAQQADDWISNLPTAVTKENIAGVEAELAALQKLIDSMSAEGKSYMWNAKQLELIKTIVADYHIELAGKQDAFKADMPANLQTKALNYKTIQVSWSSVDNADGYIVYRRTETGSWKKIADQVTDIFYKDQKAVTGRVYYYTVRAYSYTWGGKTVSSYNKDGVIGKATLGKVKIATAASENYNTIRVTWNKVFGANGYRVYRSTSKNGKYTSIGSTAKNSAVTFLDKKAVTGTTYYYKVRAYRNVNGKKVYGSYSIAVKGKAVLSAPSLSVGSTSKTAVLEWSRVKAADGYQVYASASKNGKYTRIKTTKGTGMTEEKLATGKTRYYKVRAYRKVNGKTVYGSFSKVKKVVIK